MRLYNLKGATQVDDPVHGTFKPGANEAFDGLPDAMYADLHGRPDWENEAERAARLAAEQMEKLRDPATMLAELQKMTAGQGALASLLANALGVGKSASEAETPAAETPEPEAPAADTATTEPPPQPEPADTAPPAPAPKRARKSASAASTPAE